MEVDLLWGALSLKKTDPSILDIYLEGYYITLDKVISLLNK